jgi:signal transduction histidine kinase
MHGGDVTVKSDGRGRGSEFTVLLPLAMHDGAAAPGLNANPLPG